MKSEARVRLDEVDPRVRRKFRCPPPTPLYCAWRLLLKNCWLLGQVFIYKNSGGKNSLCYFIFRVELLLNFFLQSFWFVIYFLRKDWFLRMFKQILSILYRFGPSIVP